MGIHVDLYYQPCSRASATSSSRNASLVEDNSQKRPMERPVFATSRVWVFILYFLTGGYFFGHWPGVYYNYPKSLFGSDTKLIKNITVTTALALTPKDPSSFVKRLGKSFGIFSGLHDELIQPEKLQAFYDAIEDKPKNSTLTFLDAKHLTILTPSENAPIVDWLASFI